MKCVAKNKKGEPCSALAMKGTEHCRIHNRESKSRIGQPKKHGYYSTVIQDPDELNAYLEALELTHVEKLNEISSSQMAKSRILHNAELDERTKLDIIQRMQDSAGRAAKAAADIAKDSKMVDSLDKINWLWEGEEDEYGKDKDTDGRKSSAKVSD